MGQRHDSDPDPRTVETVRASSGPQPPETRPGELEWRVWLEEHGGLDPTGWVTALSQETASLMEAGRVHL